MFRLIAASLLLLLLLPLHVTGAEDRLDTALADQKPEDVSDAEWEQRAATLQGAVEEAKLLPTPGFGEAEDQFGWSVSVDGNRALVGAIYDETALDLAGAVFVFEFNGVNWFRSARLVPSDGVAGNLFGGSVSLFGNRALVGAHHDDENGFLSGSAYVFDFDADTSTWVESAKLTASDGASADRFGFSVALSHDKALVGTVFGEGNQSNSGAAYVFDFDAGTSIWSESAKLTAGDGESSDSFGASVSFSGDRALVGAYRSDDNGTDSGSAYVFDFDAGTSTWNESAKLTAGDAAQSDWFGFSVSLTGDRALIGAYRDDDSGFNSGSAYVFDLDTGTSIWNESAKLTASDGAEEDYFGYSVSLAGDRALVGAYLDDDSSGDSGSIYAFSFDAGSSIWSESAKLTADDGALSDEFGSSVSLSGDRALVGARLDDDHGTDSGSAYLFDFDAASSGWSESAKLTAGDRTTSDEFGGSVSISGDRALVGASGDDDNGSGSGSAYVFDFDPGTSLWNESAKLTASDAAAGAGFGGSVSLSGDRALIGAFDGASGAAYVFDFDGATSMWTESAKLTASAGQSDDAFGFTLSLSGDRALVGAIADDDNGTDSGAAYVFEFDAATSTWSEAAKLSASDGEAGDLFGRSAALSGDRALVSAYNFFGDGFGSAYVFDFDAATSMWNESAKLTASDGAANDVFGISVSLSGDRALVGANGDDDNGDSSGSAYVFAFDGASWSESVKLTASDGESHDAFGVSVSLADGRAIVGAPREDEVTFDSGSAYVFNLDWIFSDNFEP